MFAVIYTDGQLDLRAMMDECKKQKWIPLLASKPKDNPDATGTILLFHFMKDAYKFIQLNFEGTDKVSWLRGVIELPEDEVMKIKSRYPVEEQMYARSMSKHPLFDLAFEVVDLSEEPDLYVARQHLTTAGID